MPYDRWSPSGTPVFCAHVAINAKEFIEHLGPAVLGFSGPGCGFSQGGQLLFAGMLDCMSQRFRRVFSRPRFLFMKNDHVPASDSENGRSASLAFQCNQTERFLHAGVNEQI